MSTVRTPIVDKNGHRTHRNKKVVQSVQTRMIPALPHAHPISEVEDFTKSLIADIPNLKLVLEEDTRTGDVVLGVISIPFKERNKGLGTKAMTAITKKADESGWTITLTPSQTQVSEATLIDFYGRFGFTVNPNWDAESYEKQEYVYEQMIRHPQGRAT